MLNYRIGGVMKVTCSYFFIAERWHQVWRWGGRAMMMNLLVMYYLPLGAPVRWPRAIYPRHPSSLNHPYKASPRSTANEIQWCLIQMPCKWRCKGVTCVHRRYMFDYLQYHNVASSQYIAHMHNCTCGSYAYPFGRPQLLIQRGVMVY